ncbi:MAG: RNA pseudouridine synthase [Treponema sp.]|jgi:23S rRNA pseudouridine1911/1915/1917 synthase|nr:RNA pseudouridine synthase [Treponema sp.]
MFEPNIVEKKPSYLVAYKPPRMHSVFLKKQSGREDREDTLLDWCSRLYPEVSEVIGRNPWEGGILHRLDYETEGLVLFARTQKAMDSFLVQQKEGRFSKIYGAFSAGTMETLPGYPPRPRIYPPQKTYPRIVESGFRPYGPGRKTVRPVVHPGVPPEKRYRTGILAVENVKGFWVFAVRIQRGFRHQIRCHLAWLGFPLVNDPLYGGAVMKAHKPLYGGGGLPPDQPFLALRSQGLSFRDPVSGESREYVLPPLIPPAF